jgi:outer membrane protein OmpA-like peptidoglycan-associated protein
VNPRTLVLLALAGCVSPAALKSDLATTSEVLEQARKLHGPQCAPVPFADAEASLAFARTDMSEGDVHGARRHADEALATARAALEKSQSCGAADQDGDGIADVIDQCPEQPEDVDGDADADGCRDLDAAGDVDGDGVRNVDDQCLEVAEDYDGDHDEDGCPETSGDADGDGVIDATDQCPDEAEDPDGFKDADGCADPDNDGDGIPDLRDACPNAPEDLDRFEDDDGCAEEDNDRDGVRDLEDNCPDHPGTAATKGCPGADADHDGVADATDRCPDQPETMNHWLDDDGCPDVASDRVRIGKTKIELVSPILFLEGSATFDTASFAVLEDVARALKDLPDAHVRIEGHTEALADEAEAQMLSLRRAEAVFDWLVKNGVAADRFEILGLGSSKPIDTNRTSSGRARNRRIELWITS